MTRTVVDARTQPITITTIASAELVPRQRAEIAARPAGVIKPSDLSVQWTGRRLAVAGAVVVGVAMPSLGAVGWALGNAHYGLTVLLTVVGVMGLALLLITVAGRRHCPGC
jgi:hypothetical protein